MPPFLALFDIGGGELILIAVVALLLFGGRLPEVMRSLGKTVGEFKRTAQNLKNDFREQMDEMPRPPYPPRLSPPPRTAPRNPPPTPPASDAERGARPADESPSEDKPPDASAPPEVGS